jgi:hypothetical protein
MKFLSFISLISLVYLAFACGSDKKDPPPPPPPPSAEWVITATVIERNCGRCHVTGDGKSGWKASGAAYVGSAAKTKIQNGAMPKPGSPEAEAITQSDIDVLLEYGTEEGS